MQQEMAYQEIPLSAITVREAFNPRRHFDEAAMGSLTASIRSEGVIQPITVRPLGDGAYEVVAGERRFRACKEAGLDAIPAVVRVLTDEQALALAVIENAEREDISMAEEARVAHRAVSACEGSREEAAVLLGWTVKRIDSRLALLHANESVLGALERREIHFGVAQLLAQVPPETQDGTLEKVIEQGITAEQLKAKLGEFSRELAHARFDTTDCQGCPFNSSTQKSLFEFTVGAGRCSNHACWEDKTEAHIAAVKTATEETFPVVFLDRERADSERTMLQKDGSHGVGADQYEACRGCRFYGALVSTRPGEAGAVTEGVCFNVSCNREKVAEHQAELSRAATDNQAAIVDAGGNAAPSSTPASNKSGTDRASSGSAKKKANAGNPKRVREAIEAFIRQQAGAEGAGNTVVQSSLAVYGLVALAGDASDGAGDVRKLLGVKDGNGVYRGKDLLPALLAATEEQRSQAVTRLTGYLLGEANIAHFTTHDWLAMAKGVLGHVERDLRPHFVIDEAFLRTHTKAGIESLMREAGFDRWYDEQHGDKAFARLAKGKNDDFISAIVKSGFDFAGFVPAAVYQEAGMTPPAATAETTPTASAAEESA